MLDSEGGQSGQSSGSDELMFECRRDSCRGQLFTAEQRDEHRAWHNAQKEKKRGRSRGRVPEASTSEATTMFVRAAAEGSSPQRGGRARKTPKKKPSKPAPKKKVRKTRIKSVKHFNEKVKSEKNPGS